MCLFNVFNATILKVFRLICFVSSSQDASSVVDLKLPNKLVTVSELDLQQREFIRCVPAFKHFEW